MAMIHGSAWTSAETFILSLMQGRPGTPGSWCLAGSIPVLVHRRQKLAVGAKLGRTPVCHQTLGTMGILPQAKARVLQEHGLNAGHNLLTRTNQ